MGRILSHIDRFLDHGRLPAIALVAGIITIFIAVVSGIIGQELARGRIEVNYMFQYLRMARDISFEAETKGIKTLSENDRIEAVAEEWHCTGARGSDEFIIIIAGDGTCLYHSSDPSMIGVDLNSDIINGYEDSPSKTIRELILSGAEIMGRYAGRNGQDLSVALVPISIRGGYLGLVRSRKAIVTEATEGALLILWVIVGVCSIIMALCIGALYLAFRKKNRLLSLKEELYRSVVEDQAESIVRWKPDGTILFANGNFRKERGLESGNGTSLNLFSFLDRDEKLYLDDIRASLTPGHPIANNEHRMKRPDGTEGWQQWINHAIFDDRGELLEIQSSGRDITEIKRIDEALRESEGRYRFLAENIGDIVFIVDRNLNNTYSSPSIAKVTGYTQEERNGKSPMEHMPEESVKLVLDTLAWEMEREKNDPRAEPDRSVRLELQYRHKDGSIIYLDTIIRGMRNEKGAIVSFCGIGRDITERKRAEQALLDSETRYRFLAENMWDIAFVLDFNMRTVYVSPNVEKILGYTPLERMTQTPQEQLTPASFSVAAMALARELEQDKLNREIDPDRSVRLELEYYHKDGSVRILDTLFRAMRNSRGEPEGMYGLSHDITERIETERWLKSSLEEKNILLKEIHHRVKNNMQIITSLLDLQKGLVADESICDLFTVCQNRIRAMALVHEKLYQSGNFSMINFKDHLGDLIENFRLDPLMIGTVEFSLNADDVFMHIGTAIPCAMILNELMTNAVKHAFPGGRTGIVTVTLVKDEGETCILKVYDNGIGFSGSLTSSLGLQLVTGLVAQIKGSIDFNSDGGTSVTIRFSV